MLSSRPGNHTSRVLGHEPGDLRFLVLICPRLVDAYNAQDSLIKTGHKLHVHHMVAYLEYKKSEPIILIYCVRVTIVDQDLKYGCSL